MSYETESLAVAVEPLLDDDRDLSDRFRALDTPTAAILERALTGTRPTAGRRPHAHPSRRRAPVADQKVVDTMELIQDAVRDVTPVASGRHQAILIDLPVQLPPVWVDEDMARRVLINLMENASKFSPAGGRIEVSAREEGDMIHLWVKDNGPGIPAAEQEHIFNKFIRLHGNNRPGGLGIGLAFCRLAVLGHGGRIWVESEPGKGAAFHFTFPIATRAQLGGDAKS